MIGWRKFFFIILKNLISIIWSSKHIGILCSRTLVLAWSWSKSQIYTFNFLYISLSTRMRVPHASIIGSKLTCANAMHFWLTFLNAYILLWKVCRRKSAAIEKYKCFELFHFSIHYKNFKVWFSGDSDDDSLDENLFRPRFQTWVINEDGDAERNLWRKKYHLRGYKYVSRKTNSVDKRARNKIQCDQCFQWFHFVCIGGRNFAWQFTRSKTLQDASHICGECSFQRFLLKFKNLKKPELTEQYFSAKDKVRKWGGCIKRQPR